MTFSRWIRDIGINNKHVLKLCARKTPPSFVDLKLYLEMIYEIVGGRAQYTNWLNGLDFLDFFETIGIDNISKIYDNDIKNIFADYLIDKYNDMECSDDELLKELGFNDKFTELYLYTLDNYVEQDTMINWIYVIVETLFCKVKLEYFCLSHFNIQLFKKTERRRNTINF